jgi:2-phospho-L-lactate guanylyltransferase
MKVSVLIPVKGFTNAKQRLAQYLGPAERELLAEVMFRDVLTQAVAARGIDACYVVTADAGVGRLASSLGASIVLEDKENGETEAVNLALERMKRLGIQAVLVIPADIPLLRSSDIEHLLDMTSGENPASPFALLVPSHDRMGTNALLLSPPDVIRLGFGYDSFSYHLSEVASRRLPLLVLENERIGLDIDEPKDLAFFSAIGREGLTYGKLLDMGVSKPSQSGQPLEGS